MPPSTATSGRALLTARRDATATTLAGACLETLRTGPRRAGTDTATHDGVPFVRRWTATDGRGRPATLAVTVDWPGHALALTTEAMP